MEAGKKYDFSKFSKEDRAIYKELLESQPYNPKLQALFEELNRQQRNQTRWDERHRAEDAYNDSIIYEVLANLSTEETVLSRERINEMRAAIEMLPTTQRRRLWLHYFEEMTLTQIANAEGVSKQSIQESITGAIKNLQKTLR